MFPAPAEDSKVAPSASTARAVSALLVHQLHRDTHAVAIPRAESQLVIRSGPSVPGGLDVHVTGARPRVHRKLLGAGHWSATARISLGAHQAVLGVPASSTAGRVLTIAELWGEAATEQLLERLARAQSPRDAASILDRAIGQQLAHAAAPDAHTQLALAAAEQLRSGSVHAVAERLGVSDRHLRRVFHDAFGVSPKAFARLRRFRHAVRIARTTRDVSWASIAAHTGYYDQAHLIAEFRSIAGVTPRVLLDELAVTATSLTR